MYTFTNTSSSQIPLTISIILHHCSIRRHVGDSHDPAMTPYGKTIAIDLSKDSPLSISDFKIVVYPSSAFYKQYNTSQPSQIAIVVAVLVFVVFVLLYVSRLYDQRQKQKLHEEEEHLKQSQAEAKLAEAEAAANASEAGKLWCPTGEHCHNTNHTAFKQTLITHVSIY